MSSESDPMNFAIALGGRVDTTPPCPAAGSYVATLSNVDCKPNSKGTGNNLILQFQLDNPGPALPSASGEPKTFSAGFRLTEWLPLQQSDNPNAPDFRVKICKIYDAIAGTDDDTRPSNVPFGSLLQKKLILVIEPQHDEQYGMQPRIKKFQYLAQS